MGMEWSLSFKPLSRSEVSDSDIITMRDSMAMLLLVSHMPPGKPPVTMATTNANIIIAGLLARILRGFTPGRGRRPINWFRERRDKFR